MPTVMSKDVEAKIIALESDSGEAVEKLSSAQLTFAREMEMLSRRVDNAEQSTKIFKEAIREALCELRKDCPLQLLPLGVMRAIDVLSRHVHIDEEDGDGDT